MNTAATPAQREALRKKSLGELGELVALKALVDAGFTQIQNLNDLKRNFPFADILAKRGKKRVVISVKARNRNQANGTLNTRYKLGSKAFVYARRAEKEYNAEAYWMAIPFDTYSYSVYLGSVKSLEGGLGIPVGRCINDNFGECLVANKRHFFDFSYFTNRGLGA